MNSNRVEHWDHVPSFCHHAHCREEGEERERERERESERKGEEGGADRGN